MKIKILKGCDAFKQGEKYRKCNTGSKREETEVGMSSNALTVMWTT